MAHLLVMDLPGGNDIDILVAAMEGGHSFSFLTSDLQLYQSQPSVKYILSQASALLETPSFDYQKVENQVLQLHAQHPIDAVICLIDIRIIDASRLAERLGLRFLNVNSAMLLRDKFSVRKVLAEKRIVPNNFAVASNTIELKAAVEQIGLPVIIKPVDGYGSQNIVALRYPEDLDPLLNPLDELMGTIADYGLGVMSKNRYLVERYLEGKVIGCDTLTIDGHHYLLGVNEKEFYESPSFAIRGGCFTPNSDAFSGIQEYVFAILNAVNFDWGATHIELMVTNDGLELIEINPRLVGAKIPRLIGYALSRSVHRDLIDLHLGLLPNYSLPSEVLPVAVTRWIVAQQSGTLDRVELPQWYDTRIRCVEILKHNGEPVQTPFENADRIGYVMTCAATRESAEALAERYVSEAVVVLKHANSASELGQFIPLIYHYNMLSDRARMSAFEAAIEQIVQPGSRVLELGGGTATLSFFASRRGANVICVEKNHELVREARRILAMNPGGERVTVIEADAFDYLPTEPVDVVICEMLHVGMFREKQIALIDSFKKRYRDRFGQKLPLFIPEAFFQAIQPVQQSFEFHGYYAPTPSFQDPYAEQHKTVALGVPVIYQSSSYANELSLDCSWEGRLTLDQPGTFNALRLITKNILAVNESEQNVTDWYNQYLVIPLKTPKTVKAGDQLEISFAYLAGDPITSFQPQIGLSLAY